MSATFNRREFLAAAATTGVGLSFSGAAEQGANNKLVVAVMGTGGRGTALAKGFANQPNVEVAYCCDVDQARMGKAAEEVSKLNKGSNPKTVGDFRRILDDKTVDALVVATCNHWHAPAAILACAAGKHVYVEKPCSHTAREGELLIEAARKYKKQVQMGNQRRSYGFVAEAMQKLKEGIIGRAYFAQSWYTNNRPTIGKGKEGPIPEGLDYELWQGPAPRRAFRTNYLHYNWHWFWNWGNGELGNNGIHTIDLCRWGLGVDYPIHVSSSGGRYRFDDDQETPDTQIVSFAFDGKKSITWEGFSCNRPPDKNYFVMFHGENGTLGLADNGYTVFDLKGKELNKTPGSGNDGQHLGNFLDACRGKVKLNSDIEEAHKSTLLCHVGNIAQRTGRSLKCDPKNGHILDDKQAMSQWNREYEKGWKPKV